MLIVVLYCRSLLSGIHHAYQVRVLLAVETQARSECSVPNRTVLYLPIPLGGNEPFVPYAHKKSFATVFFFFFFHTIVLHAQSVLQFKTQLFSLAECCSQACNDFGHILVKKIAKSVCVENWKSEEYR